MDPISLTAAGVSLSTVLSGAGTAAGVGAAGLGAYSNIMGGKAKAAQAQYQAGIADLNRRLALQDADYARAVGESQAQASGMKTRYVLGQQLTAQSGSNIDVGSGSAARVRSSTADIGRQDQTVIRANAAKRAFGHEVEAAQATGQGEVYKMTAKQAEEAGTIGAVGSILGGVSSVSDRWLQAKTKGIGSTPSIYSGGVPSLGG